jgi:hypothetical protein
MPEHKITILARVPFVDRKDPKNPVEKMAVTFQLPAPDNRVASVEVNAFDVGKPGEDQAIADKIKSMGEFKQEQKTIKT